MATEQNEETKRPMDGVIMERINSLEGKIDKVIDGLHKVDNKVTAISTKFDGQISTCGGKFLNINEKHASTRNLVIENVKKLEAYENKIEAYENKVKGGTTVIEFMRKWLLPAIVFMCATAISYFKGKGLI